MATIDFNQIRATPKSKNDSFESLSIQLFKENCQPPQGADFFSLRGDGGDGGVEAYFKTPTGEILGVQAKYFFKLGASELGQIKHSLQTALTNHPTLIEYWIYLPFDLTGKVAAGKRGQSEVERFEKWRDIVAAQHPNLQIKLVTAEEARQQILSIDQAGGLTYYWFNENILTSEIIQGGLDAATAFAGPRYSSDLDIITEAHEALDAFGGVYDFARWRTDIWKPVINNCRSKIENLDRAFSSSHDDERAKAQQLITDLQSATSSKRDILNKANLDSTFALITELKPICESAVQDQENHFHAKHGKDSDTPSFRQFHAEYMCDFPAGDLDSSRELLASIIKLEACLRSPLIHAFHASSFLLTGPTGSGKTHSIVSFAKRRLDLGAYSIVLFGEDFDNSEPWEAIRSKLGLGADIGREKLLACMQACAKDNEGYFVIAIDALNESDNARKWKNKLPEIIQQTKEFDAIKIVVSTRDIYANLVVDERFPGFAYNHIGFTRDFHDVLSSFSARYEIESDITPIFTNELRNPLLLHLIFKTHKQECSTVLDVSTSGFTALFSKHIKQVDDILRNRLGYANPRNITRLAMSRLSDSLAESTTQTINWEAAIEAIRPILGSEITPEKFIDELSKEQLLIMSMNGDDDYIIRFGYQKFGDILRASSLVQSASANRSILAEKLSLLSSIEQGVLESLASILPEELGIEITDDELGLDSNIAHELFVKSLTWRSKESITPNIERHLFGALQTPDLWPEVFECLFKLSVVPGHFLNADNWFKQFQWNHDAPSRDAYLSISLRRSYENKEAIWFLLESLENIESISWPRESYELASSALLWCCSATDRRVRDQATRCLTLLFMKYPEISLHSVKTFGRCNDDYIIESQILAMYSACLLYPGAAEHLAEPLNDFIRFYKSTKNILIREHAELLKHEIIVAGIDSGRVSNTFAKTVMPASWPTHKDVNPLLSLERLPSNMDLLKEGIQPDFWRYIIEPRLRIFDINSLGITHENIACWIMKEALSIGYPGNMNGALKHDLVTLYEHGSGRSKPKYAETIGKKCYWIAFHRLIGILAGNVPVKKSSWESPKAPDRLWSLDLREVDVTDIRDLIAVNDNPLTLTFLNEVVAPETNKDIQAWLFADDYYPADSSIALQGEDGSDWINLKLYSEDHIKRDEDDVSINAESFLCIASYNSSFVDQTEIQNFDLHNYSNNHCYKVYLGEYPQSPAFKQCIAEQDTSISDESRIFSTIDLLRGGEWEYDFSSTEEQTSIVMPCPSLVEEMNLHWDCKYSWLDNSGEIAITGHSNHGNSSLYIRKEVLDSYLLKTGKYFVISRFSRKQFSSGFTSGYKLKEVSSRYAYRPSDGSFELISEDIEEVGF